MIDTYVMVKCRGCPKKIAVLKVNDISTNRVIWACPACIKRMRAAGEVKEA